MKQRIMVTGAAGFLGQALVETLVRQRKYEVTAVCHSEKKCRLFPPAEGFRTAVFDLAVPETITMLLEKQKPDIIFHLAAVARLHEGQQHPEKAVGVNLTGTILLLQQAAAHQVSRFVFTSSDLAREAKSVTGITKLLMERYLQRWPEPFPQVVSFRMPNLLDFPGSVTEIFARQIAENKDLSITDERMARRFISRDEAAEYLLYLSKNGENRAVYSIQQEPVFIKDIALKMIAESGKNLKLKIIGARPGEKLYQASYSDKEAVPVGFRHLAKVNTDIPSLENIFACIRRLPVSSATRAALQNHFKSLF